MGSVPRVSVIMAVYNAGPFLTAAVESVLRQSFLDFELIVADDGSTDGSGTVLEQFAADDHRIRLVRQQNLGHAPTLNKLAGMATGEFLARMDADDVCLPDRFERQVALLDDQPAVGVLGGFYEIIDHAGRPLRVMEQPTADADLQEICLTGRVPICHPLVMMRRNLFEQVGGYRPDLDPAEDLDLWLRMGEISELACLDQVLLRYRMHDKSLSEAAGEKQSTNMKIAVEEAWRRRGVEGRYEFLGGSWRPGTDAASRMKYALQYGWWALQSGHRRTAWSYGWQAARTIPCRRDGWKLMACALLNKGAA
jgi:glycosyltransferase involved in cell wall biosynthesis